MGAPRRFTRLHLLANRPPPYRFAPAPVAQLALSQSAFEKTPDAVQMEQRAHAILRHLGFGRKKTRESPAPLRLFSLESDNRALQQALDEISFAPTPLLEIEWLLKTKTHKHYPGKTASLDWRQKLPRFRKRTWRQMLYRPHDAYAP